MPCQVVDTSVPFLDVVFHGYWFSWLVCYLQFSSYFWFSVFDWTFESILVLKFWALRFALSCLLSLILLFLILLSSACNATTYYSCSDGDQNGMSLFDIGMLHMVIFDSVCCSSRRGCTSSGKPVLKGLKQLSQTVVEVCNASLEVLLWSKSIIIISALASPQIQYQFGQKVKLDSLSSITLIY